MKSMTVCLSVSPTSTLRFKDLVPVLYQEGRQQGDPVTLGVGGFGRVELVCVCESCRLSTKSRQFLRVKKEKREPHVAAADE